MSQTAPIAKLVTVKTYRPVKVFAGLCLLFAIIAMLIAGISSEWLSRFDNPQSTQGTTFYRYGFWEFCNGYYDMVGREATWLDCRFWPIAHKSWVQLCFGLYVTALFLTLASLGVLCLGSKLESDNAPKWRLYKTCAAFALIAGLLLASCMLIWSGRFIFEVSILHRQRLYTMANDQLLSSQSQPQSATYPFLRQPRSSLSSSMALGRYWDDDDDGDRQVRKSSSSRFNYLRTQQQEAPLFYSSAYHSKAQRNLNTNNKNNLQREDTSFARKEDQAGRMGSSGSSGQAARITPGDQYPNVTITGEMSLEIHSSVWPQVMATVHVGFGYVLPWIAVFLLFLPSGLIIIDGKKDEFSCEEQLVYPPASPSSSTNQV